MVKGMRKRNFPGRMGQEISVKKSRFTEAQAMGVLRQAEGKAPLPELPRERRTSSAAFCKRRV